MGDYALAPNLAANKRQDRTFDRTMKHLLVITALLLLAGSPAGAQQHGQVVDQVVAVVEDGAIFQSEVEQAVKQVMVQRGVTDVADEARDELERQALQELINSRLIVAKAQTLGIDVTFSEVEQYVDRAINENIRTLGGQPQFEQQLAREGLTMDQLKQLYRDQIRNRMIVERVLAAEINRGNLQVTDEEIRAIYNERKADMPMRPAVVHLETIYISLQSADNADNIAKQQIDDISQRISRGEDFADLAREYSEDPSGKNGGRLGSVKPEDLADDAFAAAASSLGIGEVSDPVKTQHGYHLITVTGRDPSTGAVDLSHILIKVKAGEDDVQQVYAHATSVHDEIMAGGDFNELAKQHSDDPGTADSGGDLGWLRIEDLPEFFRDVLQGMSPGDVSQVLREPDGFRIVRLLDREEARPYEYDEVRDDLKQLAEQQKLAESYDTYVAGLRDEFYVDVRVN